MSRTDKDNPWWVRADYFEPYHGCGWRRVRKYVPTDEYWPWGQVKKRFVGYAWKYMGDCELPAETPVREHPKRYGRKNVPPLCWWDAVWPDDYNMQMRGRSVKKDCHKYYHGPQRMNERLAAREVIKGNDEAEFPDGRTRHSVLWDLS